VSVLLFTTRHAGDNGNSHQAALLPRAGVYTKIG
jgi:hypothetical protein